MRKIILSVVVFMVFSANVLAQKDTLKQNHNKLFLQEIKLYKQDSLSVNKLFYNSSISNFFWEMLAEVYADDSLSSKQSFSALIIIFPKFLKVIPKYKKKKEQFYSKASYYSREKVDAWALKKEMFENNLFIAEEQEMQKRMEELESHQKKEVIAIDTLGANTDTTKVNPVRTEVMEDRKLKSLQQKQEAEKRAIFEAEKKLILEQKRMEEETKRLDEERKRMEKKENEENGNGGIEKPI